MSDRDEVIEALPSYEVGEELGRGAWGIVYAARHRQLDRQVAIKQLPRLFGTDPQVRARFLTEARLLAGLDHPHVVHVIDFVEHDGLCLIVMERLTGGTVWERHRRERLSPEAACAVIVAVAAGLHHAHGRGVLHRDVKPENLMFSGDGVLKVTDFGIAKVVGGSQTMATRAGYVLGTPSYLAPEQAKGAELSAATDVYATTTVLYELLAGALPFPEVTDAVLAVYQHVHEDPRPLLEVAPHLPAALAEVTARGLARDPNDRYPTAAALAAAIDDAGTSIWGSGWVADTGIKLMGVDTLMMRRAPATAMTPTPTELRVAAGPPPPQPPDQPVPTGAPMMATPAPVPTRRPPAWALALGGAVAALALLVVAVAVVRPGNGKGGSPGEARTSATNQASPNRSVPTSGEPPEVVRRLPVVGIAATRTAPSGTDSNGDRVSYDAAMAVDGRPTTAWRAAGDATGEALTIRLGARSTIAGVGLIPGYAKVDAGDGTDRFLQNRRVVMAKWIFDDGTVVEHQLEDTPAMQLLEVDATSTTVRLVIGQVTGHGGRDFTAISEIEIHGAPARARR